MKSITILSDGLIGVATVRVWLCSRSAWLVVDTVDDEFDPATTDLVGTVWVPELTSIALTMVAALLAIIILGSMGRRIIGGLAALLAITAPWTPMTLLARGKEGVDS